MQIVVEGHETDPDVAWERLGDSDFLNRLAGNGALQMRLEPVEGGAPRIVGDMSGPLGRMSFVEDTNAWVWQRWFKQDRSYRSSPIAASRFELRLEPSGGGVVPRMQLELEPSVRLLSPLLSPRLGQIRKRWQAALDALPPPGAPAPPAVQRDLGRQAEAALAAWARQGRGEIVEAVGQLFRTERATELQQLRAFALADEHGLDRSETLHAMLHGVRAGALELYWSVRCKRCHGEVAAAPTLSDVADHAACPSCRIDFDTDLGANVEVLFAPHPGILPRVEQRFCTVFPAGAPELRCAFRLEPGEQIDEEVALAPGRWLLGPGGGEQDLELDVGGTGTGDVRWTPGEQGARELRAGPVRLQVTNDGTASRRILLVEAEARDDIVPASLLATLPEFRRELGSQVLAPDVRIGTRAVAVVFTDLSGSTALYEAVGDARAYALVRDHFRILREQVEGHGGVVVKTIGDAVMASFHTASAALRAALAMREAFDGWIDEQGLGEHTPRLNIGLHVGPALAVHSDQAGLDWFGRTVNVAARAQGAAREGAIVWTPEVHADPLVVELGLGAEPFEAAAKGLGKLSLYRLKR